MSRIYDTTLLALLLYETQSNHLWWLRFEDVCVQHRLARMNDEWESTVRFCVVNCYKTDNGLVLRFKHLAHQPPVVFLQMSETLFYWLLRALHHWLLRYRALRGYNVWAYFRLHFSMWRTNSGIRRKLQLVVAWQYLSQSRILFMLTTRRVRTYSQILIIDDLLVEYVTTIILHWRPDTLL